MAAASPARERERHIGEDAERAARRGVVFGDGLEFEHGSLPVGLSIVSFCVRTFCVLRSEFDVLVRRSTFVVRGVRHRRPAVDSDLGRVTFLCLGGAELFMSCTCA